MTELYDYLTGTAVIKAYTDNAGALADKLSENVKFRKLSVKKSEVLVTVGIFDEKFTEKLIASMNIPYENVCRRGLLYFLRRYAKRTGLIVGAAVSAVMIFFLSNIVLKIEISGNDAVTENEIMSMLRDSGIEYGAFIPSMNLRRSEKELLSMSDKFTAAVIRSSGFRIIVEVTEGGTEISTEKKNQPSNIISLYDAQITKVNVKSGMLLQMDGDTVRRGEILISGIVSEKFGGSYNVRAMGEITGRYRRTAEFSEDYISTCKIFGEEYRNKYIKIFGKYFSLPGNTENTDTAEYIKSSKYISFMGLTLPLEIIVVDAFPYSLQKVTATKEELTENAHNKLEDFENNLLKNSGEKIIDRKVKITESQKGITLKAEYLLEGSIGIEKPFFPLKVSDKERAEADNIKK